MWRWSSRTYREYTTFMDDHTWDEIMTMPLLNYVIGQVVTAMNLLKVSTHANGGQNVLPIQPCDTLSRHCRRKFNSGWSYMGGSDGNAIICQSMNCVMGQMDNSANIFTDKKYSYATDWTVLYIGSTPLKDDHTWEEAMAMYLPINELCNGTSGYCNVSINGLVYIDNVVVKFDTRLLCNAPCRHCRLKIQIWMIIHGKKRWQCNNLTINELCNGTSWY